MKKAEKLYLLKTPQEPWQEISIKIVEPLLGLDDKDTIMVIVDWFIKIIRLKAIMTAVSSKEIAKIYSGDMWKIYRVPKKILSDIKLQFAS